MDTQNTLGACRQCFAPLATYGTLVRCTSCKLPLSAAESAGLFQSFRASAEQPQNPADMPIKAPVPPPPAQPAVEMERHARVPDLPSRHGGRKGARSMTE
jgi:hypothetical protein